MIDTRKKIGAPLVTDNDNEKSASTPNAKAQSRQTNSYPSSCPVIPSSLPLSNRRLSCLYSRTISSRKRTSQ